MHRLHLKTIFHIFLLLLDRTCECQFSYREPWLQKQKLQEKQEPRLSLPKENKKLLFISKKLLLFWKNPHQHFSLDIYRPSTLYPPSKVLQLYFHFQLILYVCLLEMRRRRPRGRVIKKFKSLITSNECYVISMDVQV